MRDWLITRLAGKLLMAVAAVGVWMALRFDILAGRAVVEFGVFQVGGVIFLLFCGFVGWVLNDFTKDL